MNRSEAIEAVKILDSLLEISETKIIVNTFLSAFSKVTNAEKSQYRCNKLYPAYSDYYPLCGSFKVGPVSGRLASSDPNLQNIPATSSKYAKPIKKIFKAPSGWLMAGVDFNGLEDRISALTTKDPNRLKVFTEGYDGHCLRAYSYFGDKMPDIKNNIESINSIAEKYKDLRQKSKPVTFALTYQGTAYTLVKNLGFSEKEAEHIEKRYHELYKVADAWVQNKLQQASVDGYVTLAFGLRLRTPILSQVIYNSGTMPNEAKGEARTAGNALGQSYGMLNHRAANEFLERLLASPYKYDIRPISHIHDSQYFLVRKDPEVLSFLNNNIIECIEWQDLEEIRHESVHLGGTLELYCPDWSSPIEVPNKCSVEYLKSLLDSLPEQDT